jgi:hypothetical protein
MTVVGLLHTVPSLAVTFDDLVRDAAPDLRRIHVADAWLLDTARRDGVTPAVRETVAVHVRHLVSLDARAVLVTCSSIGEAAEAAASTVDIPVVRVDAPMAEEAAVIAAAPGSRGRITVLATLPSTLGPTGRLVERAVGGRPIEVTASVVDGAAEAGDRGDRDRVDELVAAALVGAAADADVVVLAQASMARAAARVDVAVPVLSSPAGGVEALLTAARR